MLNKSHEAPGLENRLATPIVDHATMARRLDLILSETGNHWRVSYKVGQGLSTC